MLGRLDRVRELRALSIEQEGKYTQAKEHVDSVRQGILDSQGFLGEWQSTLLSHVYESLAQGNYSSAVEWAKNADDLPREPPHDDANEALSGFLWRASVALLGIVVSLILLRSKELVNPGIAHGRNLRRRRIGG